jgi:hypothetical protein
LAIVKGEEIRNIQMLDQAFPGGRATKTGKHHKWDKIFIRVKPADSDTGQ